MTLSVDTMALRRTRWRAVADHYREQIEQGELAEGDRFPSRAQMQADHGIWPNTAHRVLKALESEGYVRVVDGVGAFVQRRPPE